MSGPHTITITAEAIVFLLREIGCAVVPEDAVVTSVDSHRESRRLSIDFMGGCSHYGIRQEGCHQYISDDINVWFAYSLLRSMRRRIRNEIKADNGGPWACPDMWRCA